MRKTRLPISYKGGAKCVNCKALLIHSYNWDNKVFQWKCPNCNATRYEKNARFKTKFITASEVGK